VVAAETCSRAGFIGAVEYRRRSREECLLAKTLDALRHPRLNSTDRHRSPTTAEHFHASGSLLVRSRDHDASNDGRQGQQDTAGRSGI